MARIFAWCDSPLAPTGFGRSANHVLFALHEAGHEITQLAVNCEASSVQKIPWKVHLPTDRANDPYGLRDLDAVLQAGRHDLMWTTFDPEVPFTYPIAQGVTAIERLLSLRASNPGFKIAGWFPVDGGPLSDAELAMVGLGHYFDAPVTMSPHVYDLIEWTLKLKGQTADREALESRLKMIPHGIELDRYRIVSDAEKYAAKVSMNLPADAFVVLQLERNQQRKQNYLGLETMELLFKRRPELRGKVVLYQHMVPNEETEGCNMGYNLPELAWRYGLKPGEDVFWPPGWVDEADMPSKVYASADAFLSVSTGEGFQYPAWEALAMGVPIVVPNDSARKAWFTHVPNAHLYETQDRRLVLRGGYKRRMAYANPAAAAKVIRKLVEKPVTDSARKAGRSFVRKTADVIDVKRQWVEVMEELDEQLQAERQEARLVSTKSPEPALTVTFRARPGVGDLIMAAPALAKVAGPVRLHIPRDLLEIASLCELGDQYSTEPAPPGAEDLSDLYAPAHRLGWSDPSKPRQFVFAERLGVDLVELAHMHVTAPTAAAQQARAQFLEGFGVDPSDCIAICLESGNPSRCMPAGYLQHLIGAVKALDATPLLIGRQPLGCRRVGVIDLTGQTDLPTLATLLGEVSAVVATDSGALHIAAMQGTPVVGCFTLFAPEARMAYYAGPQELLTPTEPIDGVTFPHGLGTDVSPQAWWDQISAARISAALGRVLGLDAEEAAKVTKW